MIIARLNILAVSLALCVYGSAHAHETDKTPQYCRDKIANMVCVVEPVQNVLGRSDVLERPCLPKSEIYRSIFLDIYEHYSGALQKTMCGLNRIFVEQSFWASGYAHIKTNAIGIRQDILDKNLSLSEWATWKERLAFGAPKEEEGPADRLPTVSANLPQSLRGAAYYIMTHEIAHIIDMANGASAKSFANWSWRAAGDLIQPTGLSPNWKSPCFYLCRNKNNPISEGQAVYETLRKSPFISLYATRNPAEDFAETLTYYVLAKHPSFEYRIHTDRGLAIDIKEKLSSAIMRDKLADIDKLLRNIDKGHHAGGSNQEGTSGPYVR